MSKTVITASGNSPESLFDLRFGRAAWFCVYDEATGNYNFFENENLGNDHGAGIKVAERMIEWKVNKIISGDFGTKAKELLDKFDVQLVIIQDDEVRIQDIINKLKNKP
jgi:predicted Fe-Mo cluster-binding NifX family protein